MAKSKSKAVPTAEEVVVPNEVLETQNEAVAADAPVTEPEGTPEIEVKDEVVIEETADMSAEIVAPMPETVTAEDINDIPEFTEAEMIIETQDTAEDHEDQAEVNPDDQAEVNPDEDFNAWTEENIGELGLEENILTAAENESIYSFSVEKLEEYLSSAKPQDRIMQESVGGNFISSIDHEIYVPLSLFK